MSDFSVPITALSKTAEFIITLKHTHDRPVVNIGLNDKYVFVPAELCQIERLSSLTEVI